MLWLRLTFGCYLLRRLGFDFVLRLAMFLVGCCVVSLGCCGACCGFVLLCFRQDCRLLVFWMLFWFAFDGVLRLVVGYLSCLRGVCLKFGFVRQVYVVWGV